jgi:uncharacterized membrane protein
MSLLLFNLFSSFSFFKTNVERKAKTIRLLLFLFSKQMWKEKQKQIWLLSLLLFLFWIVVSYFFQNPMIPS